MHVATPICSRRALLVIVVLACTLAAPGPAAAQPFDLDTPADSPLWWTVTDALSPAELRAALRDPEAHLARYREALAAGVVSAPLTREQEETLSFYYNRRLTPELTPMWLAFQALAIGRLLPQGEDQVRSSLVEFGLSEEAADVIIESATRQQAESQALGLALAAGSNEYVEIQREAIEARGGGRRAYAEVVSAARRGDFGALRPVTSLSNERLAELRTDWLRNPITEVAEPRLLELKATLDDWSWIEFRRYLLEVVVAGMGQESKDFDPGRGVIR